MSNTPTINSLIRSIGTIKVEAFIKLWLIDLNLTLDLKKPLKEHQIDQIAMNVVNKYRSLNIADINLVFQRAKNGFYGDFYDRITVPTVLKWFRVYFEDRCSTAASKSYQNHIQHKSAFANTPRSSENTLVDRLNQAEARYKKAYERSQAAERIKKVKQKLNKIINPH
ncbi:conserved hypothetical protein [Tenacibaculum sp. 190524A02b]|uniref:Uncharacterized protein n=1 Tax=Tenacibaculum vairaonense TaxID=3137860 RepID=A0ABM9PQZ0_9FLAO